MTTGRSSQLSVTSGNLGTVKDINYSNSYYGYIFWSTSLVDAAMNIQQEYHIAVVTGSL